MNDINSILEDISRLFITENSLNIKYNNEITKNWIKFIEEEKFTNNLEFLEIICKYEDIECKKVADIIIDVEKRNTVVSFVNTISEKEWIYLFVINKHISKIGGTRTGLKKRTTSYLCGHHIKERGKSGDCSKTNAFIYNTFDFYLRNNFNIEMYAFEVPEIIVEKYIYGKKKIIKIQSYHNYEKELVKLFEEKYGRYPYLNNNL